MRAALVIVALALSACSFGNAQWRRDSYDTTVELHDAGDQRCSDPAPWTSFRACLGHDAAYQVARNYRCRGDHDARYTSEAARFAADLTLAQQMALDGYGELWTMLYLYAVRWGGWVPWYFGECPSAHRALPGYSAMKKQKAAEKAKNSCAGSGKLVVEHRPKKTAYVSQIRVRKVSCVI